MNIEEMKMDRIENFGGHDKPIELIMSENSAWGFKRGLISSEKYFFSFTLGLLDGSEETWDQCFETIPPEIDRQAYLKYLQEEIEACDFEPYPITQVFEYYTEEQVNMVKQEWKPKYMAIVAFARRRLG
jgi:hypothetical protein